MAFNWPAQCFEAPGELEPNPDVGGIGVLIGFIGTAWFSILLVVLHYLLVFNPEINPFENKNTEVASPQNRQDWVPNHVDQAALKAFTRLSQWMDGKLPAFMPRWLLRREYLTETDNSNKWTKALEDAVRSICNVQLLTGLGILLSGFFGVYSSSISAYHWHLITYLAWFSHLTYVACLTVSRGDLHRNQVKRRLRLFLMAILCIGLLTALGPTMWFNWMHSEETASMPASNSRCFFHPYIAVALFDKYGRQFRTQLDSATSLECDGQCDRMPYAPYTINLEDTQAFRSMLCSVLFIVLTFFTQLVKLIQSWSNATKGRLCTSVRQSMLRSITKAISQSRGDEVERLIKSYYIVSIPRLSLIILVRVYADLFSSKLLDAYWLVISACWGTLRLYHARNSVQIEEDQWSFGQVLPVFLLVGPIAAAFGPALLGGTACEEQRDANRNPLDAGGEQMQQVELSVIPPRSNPQRTFHISPSLCLHNPNANTPEHLAVPRCFEILRERSRDEEITGQLIIESLEIYYLEVNMDMSVILLACFQILPATIVFLTKISTAPSNSTFYAVFTQVGLSVNHPLNCFLVIVTDLSWGTYLTKRKCFSVSIIVWGFMALAILWHVLFSQTLGTALVAIEPVLLLVWFVSYLKLRGINIRAPRINI